MSSPLLRSTSHLGNHRLTPSRGSSFIAKLDSCKFTTTTPSLAHVAFIGLGNMGLQMALNLARNKPTENGINIQQLTVHDLHQPNMTRFMKLVEEEETNTQCTEAQDLIDVASSTPDFIVTSLPTCEASESVTETIVKKCTQEKGILFIDTSTISVSTSRRLHDLVTSASPTNYYVDAPVSGGVKGATDATLTFMVGCSSPETFVAIQPVLQKMGKSMIPCGGPGSGSAVKLCNNAALAAQMVGICEAMNLGEKLGVDPKVLAGVMNVSTAKCWSSQVNNPHPDAARDIGSGASINNYEGGFGSALMLKDLNLAIDEATSQGLAMPVSGLTRDLYDQATADGYGAKDFGVMLKFLNEMKTK